MIINSADEDDEEEAKDFKPADKPVVSSAALGLMSEGHRRIFQPVNCERSSNCLQDSHNLTGNSTALVL